MFLAYTWLVEMCHMVLYLLPFSHSVAKWITISCNIICNKSIRGKKGTKRVTFSVLMKSYIIATLQYFCTLSMVSAFFLDVTLLCLRYFVNNYVVKKTLLLSRKVRRKPRGRWVVDTFLCNLLSFDTVRSRSIFPFRYY